MRMVAKPRDGKPRGIMAPAGPLPLTSKCKHYTSPRDMPPQLGKYWAQRNDLFRLYDYDIYMTDDAWFGVTAEPIADAIAHELHQKALDRQRHQPHHPPPPRVIVDLFAGAGGNTIALARAGHWDLVVAVEIDPATLACAQHNAAVYGVPPGLIRWVRADCLDFLDRLRTRPWELHPDLRLCQGERDALAAAAAAAAASGDGTGMGTSLAPLVRDVELFASPPWGGPLYSGAEVFDLEAMEPYGVDLLHRAMAPMAHGLFLPRNGDLRQLADLVPDGARERLDVVQYCIKGGSKGIVAYYPMDESYESS